MGHKKKSIYRPPMRNNPPPDNTSSVRNSALDNTSSNLILSSTSSNKLKRQPVSSQPSNSKPTTYRRNSTQSNLKLKLPRHHHSKLRRSSGHTGFGNTAFIALFVIVIVVAVGAFFLLSPPSGTSPTGGGGGGGGGGGEYPLDITASTYSSPAISGDGRKISIPGNYVEDKKFVFVDAKLQTPTTTLNYQSRNIPLGNYRGGNYLPLVIVYTPSGNVNVGIRVCEPCGSWSFHIISRQLSCDTCGTRWELEFFSGRSGGCQSYPPPMVPDSLNGLNIDIDLTALGLIIVP